jgi:HEAT repeats
MKEDRLHELINKYNGKHASQEELKEIERCIESDEISLHDLGELAALDERLLKADPNPPSVRLDNLFYDMLAKESKSIQPSFLKHFFQWPEFAPRLAFGSFTLVVGLLTGLLLRSPVHKDEQIQLLGQEVSDLKELMMLSLLEKESATERLKAVSLTQDMDQASQKVTDALIQTLNNDDNVNVRLAALDALRAYVGESSVRQELIRSIARQDSPLVQIALAELMVELQAKASVKEFEKILHDKNTPTDVKNKIQESIRVLL